MSNPWANDGSLYVGPVTWSAFGGSVGGWAAGCSVYEGLAQIGSAAVNPTNGTVVIGKR